MSGLPVDLVSLSGYGLAVIVAAAAYRVGLRAGARRAHHLWMTWTGVSPEELESHRFDRELRRLRRDIGRPADAWPEEGRED